MRKPSERRANCILQEMQRIYILASDTVQRWKKHVSVLSMDSSEDDDDDDDVSHTYTHGGEKSKHEVVR